MNKEIIDSARAQAKKFNIPLVNALAFIYVETPGNGFSKDTGKLLIQFEPVWFREEAPYAPSGKWSVNGVEVQSKEWEAFNNAFSINPDAAMESTSIGLGQILGLHWKDLGYKSVGAMWDAAKQSEANQVEQIFRFIASKKPLLEAVRSGNTDKMAYYYNGSKYKELAKKLNREPYDISLTKAIVKCRSLV